jgi:16S rRNA (guanine527-N7)-methyltransferase
VDRVRTPLPTRVDDTPDLPAAYHDALDAGLSGLGLELEPATRAAIDGHLRLLLAWTRAINLTAIRDPVAAATLHILDSLAAVPELRRLGVGRLLDLGSGGGVPGIPLAAIVPAEALLVEPIGKKARFLETAVSAVGLADRVGVANARAETLGHDARHRGRWPAVTARAVGPLAELVELAFPLLTEHGHLIAWKRGDLVEEIRAARVAMATLGGGELRIEAVTLPGLERHRLVVVTRTGRVPDASPRDPASRRRRPW